MKLYIYDYNRVDIFLRAMSVEMVVMLFCKKHNNEKVEFRESEGKVSFDSIDKRVVAYKSKGLVAYKIIKACIEVEF